MSISSLRAPRFVKGPRSRIVIVVYVCVFVYSADINEDDKSLVIKNVVPADDGIYICEAHNGVGQISAKAQLVVNCEYISLRGDLQ